MLVMVGKAIKLTLILLCIAAGCRDDVSKNKISLVAVPFSSVPQHRKLLGTRAYCEPFMNFGGNCKKG